MRAALALLFSALFLLGPAVAQEDGPLRLSGHGGPVMDIAVSADGTRALTASFDNAVGLWDLPSGRLIRWLDGHAAAVNRAIFLDRGRAASAGDDFAILVWDLATGTAARREGHRGKVVDLARAPRGDVLASASWDGTVGLWPVAGGPPRFLEGHSAPVNAVVFLADGTLLSAGADGTILAWDAEAGAERAVLVRHGFGVNRLALDEAAGWLAYGAVDGAIRAIHLSTGAPIVDLTTERRPILALARAPDGRSLAAGDGEGFIAVIDTDDWTIRRDFRAALHGPIWALAFAGSAGVLAAGLAPEAALWPLDARAPAFTEAQGFHRPPERLSNGERQFVRKCSVCHTLTPDTARRAGPTLYDLFGRKAGTVPGYRYSEALERSDLIWTPETVDRLFDIGPDRLLPGTKMPVQRITGVEDRRDLVDFLARRTAPRNQGEQDP